MPSPEETPIKPINDKLDYKFLELVNGLKALLICDPKYKHLKNRTETTINVPENSHSESNSSVNDKFRGDGLSISDSRKGWTHLRRPTGQRPERSITGEALSAVVLCVRSGSFSDPKSCQGLAHLVEHVVPSRSQPFPGEDSFDHFLVQNGGRHNAFTEYEFTQFRVLVPRLRLEEALDRLSKCLVEPMIETNTVNKEIEKVNEEYVGMNNDHIRCEQILNNSANEEHPFNCFSWGNNKSLKTNANKTIELVKEFMAKHYTSDNIHIVVQSQHPIKTLHNWITKFFSSIRRSELKPEIERLGRPFDDNPNFNKYYLVDGHIDNELIILWCLPPDVDRYEASPLEYWSYLIRYEGKGGLMSKLWEKKLMTKVNIKSNKFSDGLPANKFSSIFAISIPLTGNGEKNLDQIVGYVFKYLQMLRRSGPQKWIFKELKQLEDNRFDWTEEDSVLEHVKRIACNLVYLPVEYVLRGNKLFKKFNKKLLQSYINEMTPQNACFIRLKSNATKGSYGKLRTEKWFATKYKMTDIPKKWLKKQKPDSKSFRFPEPNPFIATDFYLKRTQNKNRYPIIVINENRLKVWHKLDNMFNLPKAIIRLHLVCPLISYSFEKSVMTDLLVESLRQSLYEETYAATLAGLYWKVSATVTGLTITVEGFNQKVGQLLRFLIEEMSSFDVNDNDFKNFKQILSSRYCEYLKDPKHLNKSIEMSILSNNCYNIVEKNHKLNSICKKSMKTFLAKVFKECRIECLIQGNLTRKESVALIKMIAKKLRITRKMCSLKDLEMTANEIPLKTNICRVLSLSDNCDSRSSVTNYYQLGETNVDEQCMLSLLVAIIREECLSELVDQLGSDDEVIVISCDTYGISGLTVSVITDGNRFDCTQIHKKIDQFIEYITDFVSKCKIKTFREQIDSMISDKKKPEIKLSEEFARNWKEINSFNYCFDRLEKEIKCLEKISFDEFKTWVNDLLSDRQKRRKLSVQIVGYGHKSLRECLTFDGKSVKVSPQPDNGESADRQSKKSKQRLTYLKTKSGDKSGVNYISDYKQFKSQLNTYSVDK